MGQTIQLPKWQKSSESSLARGRTGEKFQRVQAPEPQWRWATPRGNGFFEKPCLPTLESLVSFLGSFENKEELEHVRRQKEKRSDRI
jgi:hypothetical protein